MADMRDEFERTLSDPDPVRRAQILMQKPLPKRFYTAVSFGLAGLEVGGYAILLDGKPVRTPSRNPLTVPTVHLAELLAEEWAAQVEVINPAAMPVTRIVNTAIDGVASDPRGVFEDIVKFAGSDLLCYRADEPEGLVARQAELWDPVLFWTGKSLGAYFILVQGIVHREQPQQAISAFADALRAYATPLGLASLHTITTLTGSAILALAFAEGYLPADDVWRAAHADEDWQIERWGMDEEAADRRKKRFAEFAAAAAILDALR